MTGLSQTGADGIAFRQNTTDVALSWSCQSRSRMGRATLLSVARCPKGHPRPRRSEPHDRACLLRPDGDRRRSKCDPPLLPNSRHMQRGKLQFYSITSLAHFPVSNISAKLGPADDEMVIARQPLRSKASD